MAVHLVDCRHPRHVGLVAGEQESSFQCWGQLTKMVRVGSLCLILCPPDSNSDPHCPPLEIKTLFNSPLVVPHPNYGLKDLVGRGEHVDPLRNALLFALGPDVALKQSFGL